MIFGLPGALAGTIIAAVIAAIVSLLGLIISKEQRFLSLDKLGLTPES